MDSQLNLKSSTIEKGLEIAKDFVDKLIMPSVEETGLLMKDHITMWRFKHQIKMLNLAKSYCEKHKIKPKNISLKILAPLLEYSSLEEDDEMQEKWAILLSNLVDSEQNIENHVFPYILSQLSRGEFMALEDIHNKCITRRINFSIEIKEFLKERSKKENLLNQEIKELVEKIEILDVDKSKENIDKMKREKQKLERQIRELDMRENAIKHLMLAAEVVPDNLFKEFEISNLIRLGLIKEVRDFYSESQTLEIPLYRDDYLERYSSRSYTNVDLDIDINSTTEIILTELGELFFKACKEKNK